MNIYEAPCDSPRGAVIVIQEAFGVNDHIKSVADRIAGAGYLAVAPDMFHRTGSGPVPYGDFEKVIEHMKVLDDDKILEDVDAAIDHLRTAGFSTPQIGIVGFCFGGRVTFLTAARRAIGAAVGYYGGGIVTSRFPMFPPLVGEAETLKAPWLGFFGDQDQSIPVDDVEQLRSALKAAPVDAEVVRFADAGHGFNRDVSPEDFREEAAANAWARTLSWFEDHLAKA